RIANIHIVGDETTPDRVISDAMGLYTGAVLTFQDLRRAESNLAKLKLFRRATVTVINDGVDEQYRDILVSVEGKQDPAAKEMKKLEGTWTVESVKIGGNKTRPGSREFVF